MATTMHQPWPPAFADYLRFIRASREVRYNSSLPSVSQRRTRWSTSPCHAPIPPIGYALDDSRATAPLWRDVSLSYVLFRNPRSGTLVTFIIAMAIAIPLGLLISLSLTEGRASPRHDLAPVADLCPCRPRL